ncbi:MAG: hypothetical protein ACFB8W_09780 [Elainellaceae cyanobacterium]
MIRELTEAIKTAIPEDQIKALRAVEYLESVLVREKQLQEILAQQLSNSPQS